MTRHGISLLCVAGLAGLLVGTGCRSASTPEPTSSSEPASSAGTEVASQQPPPATLAAGGDSVLWSTRVDLDGDGTAEEVVLTSADFVTADPPEDHPRLNVGLARSCNGDGECPEEGMATLTVAGTSQTLTLRAGYFGGVGIEVINTDTRTPGRELLIQRRGDDGEDPPYVFRIATYDGERLAVHPLWSSSGYGSGVVQIQGDGRLRVIYDECPDRLTVDYTLEGSELIKGDKTTERVSDPDSCAACPYVYVGHGDEAVFVGEILRNLNRSSLKGWQSLELPLDAVRTHSTKGTLLVELREEKDEVTYLDSVHLVVDGLTIPPSECSNREAAFCQTDGVPTVMRRGETLRLRFPVGQIAADAHVLLRANGYYVPLAPTASGRSEP